MAFTVSDYHDLIRLLQEHPEWREELRHLLLTEELLSLPEVVRELAAEVRALAEQVEALADAQKRTEERLEALAEAQRRTEESLRELIGAHKKLEATVGKLRGQVLEVTYARRVGSYFGVLLKGAKAVELRELEDALEASLSREEFRDLFRLDLLVSGRLRDVFEGQEVWLAIEVSAIVDGHGVERASRRARLLGKAGFKAIPVAVGEEIAEDAEELARVEKVALMCDGRVLVWEEAIKEWVG